MNALELTGRSATHIQHVGPGTGVLLHKEALEAFSRMRISAATDGIELTALSGFRDFQKQLRIWNAKWRGERVLHDARGRPVNHDSLSEDDLAHTILAWSALPGASRHHWGTDIDVYDSSACPQGYKVQLIPEEFLEDGHFNRLHKWLDKNMGDYGFFFPYKTWRGGISAEPWHISYAPVSLPALKDLTKDVIEEAIAESQIEGKETVLNLLPEIYRRYVVNINLPGGSGEEM